ncbi:MAG: Fructokinase [candidate division TA06 bacterium 34_109]|uniref:Fructokinase n=1 Tax=candidate division TA06 bacterium 34_109 TaxID=1635277 RepID=A0A124FZY2_UNCT6|nr:MAG: Fructokinase [candidate division TA06 bacterium 34_109]
MKVLSFGELLWDIIEGKAYLGGAPFNVACHLAKMGIQSTYISAVGNDKLGQEALKIAKRYGLDTRYIVTHLYLPTGKVDVYLDQEGNPKYTIYEKVAWDRIVLSEDVKDDLIREKWDAFCFGTLAQRTKSNRVLLFNLLSHLSCRQVFYDVNLRQNFYQKEWIEQSLKFSTILKLNEEETVILSELLLGKVTSGEDFCRALFSKYNKLKVLCITLGEKGSLVFDGYNFYTVSGVKIKVKDTVGAGDSYSAAFLFSFLSGASSEESGIFANQVGAFVASQSGAVPKYPSKLREQIRVFKCKQGKNNQKFSSC